VTTDQTPKRAANIPALFASGKIPATSASITGTPLEPISVIIVAKDAATLKAAMQQAGWLKADKPDISSLLQAAFAAWTNQPDNTAPITPSFWNTQPNEFGFQKSTSDQTLRKRHHARFWNSGFVTQDGAQIFVGTTSFDDGLVWGVLHHIDPNIDAERDRLIADLKSTGQIARSTRFRLSEPHMGADIAGDPWFTDGMAVVVWLGP
jgi:undecaprenyl-diphosphatase